jgi:hypothetical protein
MSPELNEIEEAEKILASYEKPKVNPSKVKLETDDFDKIINSEMAKVESKKIKNNMDIDLQISPDLNGEEEVNLDVAFGHSEDKR